MYTHECMHICMCMSTGPQSKGISHCRLWPSNFECPAQSS